ncbi:MAG TPA: 2-phospho-L-lactate transferase [Candidatus Limnocylindrales bacterium]|nr:2-phospho-L-lactate transferase [Candidatus Limnocylindrales bacterium]
MFVVLTGGTGGGKLIEGLAAEIDPAEITIICNTGDDTIFHGLYVSPDIDTIIYALAGLGDSERGWGIKGDTFVALEQLRRLGNDAWFKLGDKDIATHITRTRLLREGRSLSETTDYLRRVLGVRSTILPMCDERIETRVMTLQGEISFQEFFVKERWAREVTAVRFDGAEKSRASPGVLDAIRQADAVIVCPSNPITSIGPILSVPAIREALIECKATVVGASPIIGDTAISGPAHKLMIACGFEGSAFGVAERYAEFLDILLIAEEDCGLRPQIESLNVKAICADILMPDLAAKRRLARELLALVQK